VAYRVHSENPVPIWIVGEGHEPQLDDVPIFDLYRELQPVRNRSWIAFRSVPIDRLPRVLATGVDVDPPDGTIFCDDEEKAFEYGKSSFGDQARIMYALHGGYLERSFRTLPADASEEAIADVRKTYPYQYDDPMGGLYFSRLAEQANIAYESAYGYWVPSNAKNALLAVFVIGTAPGWRPETINAWNVRRPSP
jgi:hypothetical protein